MALGPPPRGFAKTPLALVQVNPSDLVRISPKSSGEPYFGTAGANRFDDYRKPKSGRFGTCYLGTTLSVAFAESVLHDEVAVNGKFEIAVQRLESRYVVLFSGGSLTLANLTGAPLKRLGADGAISSITPYDIPQRWSVALHKHSAKIDGFLYVSRHMNTGNAVVLFDRAKSKLNAEKYVCLPDYPGALRAAMDFGLSFK